MRRSTQVIRICSKHFEYIRHAISIFISLGIHAFENFLIKYVTTYLFYLFVVEMLYQRYFLKMNQNNTVHIVWLLLSLIFILALIHFIFTFILQNPFNNCFNQGKFKLIYSLLNSSILPLYILFEISSWNSLYHLTSLTSIFSCTHPPSFLSIMQSVTFDINSLFFCLFFILITILFTILIKLISI